MWPAAARAAPCGFPGLGALASVPGAAAGALVGSGSLRPRRLKHDVDAAAEDTIMEAEVADTITPRGTAEDMDVDTAVDMAAEDTAVEDTAVDITEK